MMIEIDAGFIHFSQKRLLYDWLILNMRYSGPVYDRL